MLNKAFTGFPKKGEAIPVPGIFFTSTIGQIHDINELKITLYIFWFIQHKPGCFRFVTLNELLIQQVLLDGMVDNIGTKSKQDLLKEAIQLAVNRGTLITLNLNIKGKPEEVICINAYQDKMVFDKRNAIYTIYRDISYG